MLHSADVDRVTFRQARGFLAVGYDTDQVDALIRERVRPTLRAYEEGLPALLVTADELAEVTFGMARSGYEVRAVDDFVDRVVAQLRTYESV